MIARRRRLWWVVLGVVLALCGARLLLGCGEPAPLAPGGCSPWEPESPCACDGGLPGVEVCARTDAGNLRVCRCR